MEMSSDSEGKGHGGPLQPYGSEEETLLFLQWQRQAGSPRYLPEPTPLINDTKIINKNKKVMKFCGYMYHVR